MTIANVENTKVYVPVPDVVSNYQFVDTDTVDMTVAEVGGAMQITATVKDSSITTAKLVDANVTTEKVADKAITTKKVADNAITMDKLCGTSVFTFDCGNAGVDSASTNPHA